MMKIFLWGTGCVAERVISQCNVMEQYDVIGFVDNDPEKQGQIYHGKPVFAPDILLSERADKIVILTNKYQEIYEQIMKSLKLKEVSVEGERFFYKQSLLRRYKGTDDEEIKEVIDYIKENDLQVFNYRFINKYKNLQFTVLYDIKCGLYYVMHLGKKMYFARNFDTKEAVAKYYRGILQEQDKDSPHRYLDETFNVKEGSIVVDVGAAEGNFALEIIDIASKIYIIESEDIWIEALRETFRPYEDKVVIIQRFVTSVNEGKYAMLDSLITEPINFIKMDIEGNEWDALLGAEQLIRRSEDIKCAICAYHADYDETLITSVLCSVGLRCNPTKGYMWFPRKGRNNYISTKLRRGIVRGIK